MEKQTSLSSGSAGRITPDTLAEAIKGLKEKNRRAVSLAVTELERLSTIAPALLKAIQSDLGHALVVGFTGPPGAGKSTLVNALIRVLRTKNKTVAVIAVDPSSPISGGAILGDRIRMTAALDDDGVFVRSLASRGYLGGLSPAAVRIIDAFDAAGYDFILLETVGTGQNEIDVAEIADVRIVISAPGLGDEIQAMKSGLLEIADILVVNKGDRPGAEETLHQLLGGVSIRSTMSVKAPILKTIATTGEGVERLLSSIESIGEKIMSQGSLTRRRRRARYLIARAAADIVSERIRSGQKLQLDQLSDQVLSGHITPDIAAKELIRD